MLQSIIFDNNILILMEEIINFKFQLGCGDISSAELILYFYQFILKLDSHFALAV